MVKVACIYQNLTHEGHPIARLYGSILDKIDYIVIKPKC